jgi:hypothetical protein
VLCTAPSGACRSFTDTSLILSQILCSSILLSSRLVSVNDRHACHPFEALRTTHYITKLNLKIEAERLTDSTARELGELLKASPGKCKVNFQIFSNAEGMALEAPSKSLGVNLTEEVIRVLDGMPEVGYSLS